MYKKKIACIIVLCILLMMAISCTKKEPGTVNEMPVEPTVSVEPTQEPPTSLYKCGLTGEGLMDEQTSKLRPIAVMIDNQAAARPQSGLINADIVYEIPVEGKITRFMAIFHHLESDKIGPVRSARSYFIDKALELNAVYVHCGGSPQALEDIKNLNIAALNDLNGDPCFWRAVDRSAPHNLYTSTRLMRDATVSKKLETKTAPEYFRFSDSIIDINGKKAKQVDINYGNNYNVSYQYDDSQKVYYRLVNGQRVKDKETGKEIKVINIIFEKVKTKVIDDVGRLEVGNIGSGSGYFMTAGKLIEIEWTKGSRQGKTTYKDMKGNEIILNKGNTWIQVVPDYSTVEIKE